MSITLPVLAPRLRRWPWLLVLARALLPAAGVQPAADAEHGQLVVFVQPEASDLARAFTEGTMPGLAQLCAELDVELVVRDVADGAPAEVTLTPLLVYQNHRGRSVYRGRYEALDRVRTFVRTSRRRPQGSGALELSDVLVWQNERVRLVAPLKLAPPTGSPPAGLDPVAFRDETRAAVAEGLAHFTPAERAAVGRSDRAFYMDFYPYRSDDGTLFLSTALYSEFHCKTPVWRTPADEPYTGPWSERGRLYTRAAADFERIVTEQLAGSPIGDGFDPVPADLPLASWEALGLALPPAPAGSVPATSEQALPARWRVASPRGDAVVLAFAFPPPLDYYSGEVESVTGTLDLGAVAPDGSYPDARGRVAVPARSVTMGDPDLDGWIHGPEVLVAAEHAQASFTLESLELRGRALGWGETSQVTGRGAFAMIGREVPLEVRAQLEPGLADDGTPRLLATGTFSIPLLARWGIDAPVGDDPARETLVFDFDFVLEPEP